MTETGEKTTTSTANPAVASAATGNLDFIKDLQTKGFTPYSGQQVAGFSPQQQASFGLTDAVVGNGTAPAAKSLIDQYSGAPAGSVSPDTISSRMSPYMSQYVQSALAPQLAAFDINAGQQKNAIDAQATGSGAFGDARTGINQSTQDFLNNQSRQGLVANAYNTAFNTAIGAGAQDVSNNMQAQTTNAGLKETQLNRALGGANALQGLQNQQLGVAQAQNTMGQQQTAHDQAGLTAQYNQWLMAQQYPFQTAQLMNQGVGAASQAMPASTKTTESKPDNSGLAALGSIAGIVAAPFTGGASLGLTAAALGSGGMGGGTSNPSQIGSLY